MNTQALVLDEAAELLARFESLGGVAGQGAAFAAIQREAGLSPDGMLSQAEMPETTLIHLLHTELEGVGGPRNILVGPWPNSDQWWARDPRFPLAVPSGVRSADHDLTGMTARMRRRWTILRGRLSATLATGDRVLVFRGAETGCLPALDAALRQYKSVRMLFVVPSAAGTAERSVTAWSDRVLLAQLPIAADKAAWLAVCRQALAGGIARAPAAGMAPSAPPPRPAAPPPPVVPPPATADVRAQPPAEGVRPAAVVPPVQRPSEPDQLHETIAALRASIARDPANPSRLAQLGVLQMKADLFADAIATLRRAEALAPENASIASQLVIALQRQGDIPAALAAARRSVTLDPNNPRRHLQLANVLTAAGDTASAEEVTRSAVDMDPGLPDSHVALSVLLGRLGRLPEALAAARSAVEREPTHVGALGQVGRIAGRMGQLEEAEAALVRVAGLEPNAPHWARMLRDIRQRRTREQAERG